MFSLRCALITLFVAALCSSSMGSSLYRFQRAAKPAANAAASPNANAGASPNANAAASPNANADASPAQNSAAQNQQQVQFQQQQQQFVQQQQYKQVNYFQPPQGRAAFYQPQPYVEPSQFAPGQPQPPQGKAAFYQPQPYVEVSQFAPGQPQPPQGKAAFYQPQPYVEVSQFAPSQPFPPAGFQSVQVNAAQVAQPAPVQAVVAKSAFPAAGAAPNTAPDQQAQVTGQSYDFNPVDHSFTYAFQTTNGISQQAKGYTNQNGNYVQEGSYTLYTPEGVPVSISYIADENGFQAVGDAIPQPDPVIAKAVAYLRSLPPSAEAEDNKA